MGRRSRRSAVIGASCAWMTLSPYRSRRGLLTMGNYLDKNSRSLRRRERRPSCTHTAAPVLGPRAVTLGAVAANPGPSVDVSSTASVAAPTGRVPGLRGAFIIASTPCSCVGIGDQHSGIVRLFEVSSRQCSLPYFLTYLLTVRWPLSPLAGPFLYIPFILVDPRK